MPPVDRPRTERLITDRYLEGTRLRLRRITGPAKQATQHKLTQKIPQHGGGAVQGTVTNLYLSEEEYERLAALPGLVLRKTRHSIQPLLIDVYDPPLDGLILAEVEFETDEAAAAFRPPDYVQAEVTDDPRFTGGRLVRACRPELLEWLGEFGITVPMTR